MRPTAPSHSRAWSTATSGRRSQHRAIAVSQSSASSTSWPALPSTRAIRLRFGLTAWASSTRMPSGYPWTPGTRPNSRLVAGVDDPGNRRRAAELAGHLVDSALRMRQLGEPLALPALVRLVDVHVVLEVGLQALV